VRAPDAVYWGSAALMWVITALAYAFMRHWRLQLQAATREMRGQLEQHRQDAPLAEWARHMSLTVVTHTGTVFSSTFPELAASDVPDFRNWNVPVQVTVWSDQADEELTAEVHVSADRKATHG